MRRLMNWLKTNYGSIPIYITENGFSDHLGNTDDVQRVYYLKHYINQLLKGKINITQPVKTDSNKKSFHKEKTI